jgi:hypothetical protein
MVSGVAIKRTENRGQETDDEAEYSAPDAESLF